MSNESSSNGSFSAGARTTFAAEPCSRTFFSSRFSIGSSGSVTVSELTAGP